MPETNLYQKIQLEPWFGQDQTPPRTPCYRKLERFNRLAVIIKCSPSAQWQLFRRLNEQLRFSFPCTNSVLTGWLQRFFSRMSNWLHRTTDLLNYYAWDHLSNAHIRESVTELTYTNNGRVPPIYSSIQFCKPDNPENPPLSYYSTIINMKSRTLCSRWPISGKVSVGRHELRVNCSIFFSLLIT